MGGNLTDACGDDQHSHDKNSSPHNDETSGRSSECLDSNNTTAAFNAVIILSDAKHIHFIKNALENNNSGAIVSLPVTMYSTPTTTTTNDHQTLASAIDSPIENVTKPKRQKFFTSNVWKHCFGSVLALGSGIVLTIASIAATILLKENFNTGQVGLFRFAFFLITTAPVLIGKRINPFGMEMLRMYGLLLVFRACMGSSAYLFRVFTFSKLPVGDATTIMFCSPIFVGIFARIFLGERYTKVFFISIIFGIIGCVLIARPHFIFSRLFHVDSPALTSTANRLEGTILALCSAISTGMVVVLVRKLRQFDPSVVIFHFGCVGTIASLIICASTGVSAIPLPKTWYQGLWIAALALSSSVGQWLFTVSLQYEHANIVSLIRTTDVMWAFLAQVVIFGLTPHWLSVLGASLVTFGVVLLGVTKAYNSMSIKRISATTSAPIAATSLTPSPPTLAIISGETTVRRRSNWFGNFARKVKLRSKRADSSTWFVSDSHLDESTAENSFQDSESGKRRTSLPTAVCELGLNSDQTQQKTSESGHPISLCSVASIETSSSLLEDTIIDEIQEIIDGRVIAIKSSPSSLAETVGRAESTSKIDDDTDNKFEEALVRTLAGGDDYEAPIVAADESAVVEQEQQIRHRTLPASIAEHYVKY